MGTEAHDIRTAEELGSLLRAHRKSRGLTQVDAAALAGVGERFLSEVERGKPTAEIGLVLKVLDRFGLSLTVTDRASGRPADGAVASRAEQRRARRSTTRRGTTGRSTQGNK